MSKASLPDPPWRRSLIILGLPVLFLLLGAWQVQRGLYGMASLAQDTAQLAVQAARVDAIAAVTPNRIIHFTSDPQAYGAELAAGMMHDGVDVLRRQALIERVRVGLALVTAAGGLISLLAGIAGLSAAAWAARRSRRSRDALEAAFSRIRAYLPFLLGSLVGGLALACATAVLFETAAWVSMSRSQTAVRFLMPGLLLAGLAAWVGWLTLCQLRRSLAAFVPAPLPLLGREIISNAAPGLWRFLAQVATEQGAAIPDHVAVGLMDGFFVTAADVVLAPCGTLLHGRTLHVPLPMVAMLDPGETAAIIGHELAHFASDTGYGLRFLPIYTGIERSLQALRSVRGNSSARWTKGPAITLGNHMMAVFQDAVNHWSRMREIEADQAGAWHSGAEAAARALIRTALLLPAIGAVLSETRRNPATAPADLVAAIVARAEADGLGDPAEALEQYQPHPTDSHPPSSVRLRALGLDVTAPLLAEAARPAQIGTTAFACGLFADWAGMCTAVSADARGLAISEHAERAARLREAADQPTDTIIEIFAEWRRPAAVSAAVAAMFLGTGLLLAHAALSFPINDPARTPTLWLAVAGLFAAGAAAILRAAMLWRARWIPLITLTADGFLCRGLDRMVPWIGVERLNATRQRSTNVFIHLKEMTKLPRRMSGWGVLVHARRRVVTMLGVRPRSLSPDDFIQLLHRYWSAAIARAALAGDEPGYSMILSKDELQALLSDTGPHED